MEIVDKLRKFLIWMDEDGMEYYKTYVIELVLMSIIWVLIVVGLLMGKLK